MKIWLDRDSCEANLSTCLSCFGQLMRTGEPDRGCILDTEDDGSEDMTVYMRSDGEEREPIVIPQDMREMVAYEGWIEFVDFEPRFRRNEGAERPAGDHIEVKDVFDALSERIKQLMHKKKTDAD